LINDVIDISHIESGETTLSVEPVSVSATIAEAVALMRPLAAARSISVYESCSDPDLAACADQQRLRQSASRPGWGRLPARLVRARRQAGLPALTMAWERLRRGV
jgi:hypothetical protein